MGYYTRHTFDQASLDLENIREKFEEITGYSFYNIVNGESIKWYDCEENMIELSLLYPNHLFIVNGEGENYDDVWRHYFKDGKGAKYKAEVVFPEFNPNDLK